MPDSSSFVQFNILDCTLRDGGYYNSWNFSPDIISAYLKGILAAQVDVVELGFRFLKNEGFKGACAYSTDHFLENLSCPASLKVAVMVNGADLCTEIGCIEALERLFPRPANQSPVDLVRIACRLDELLEVLPAVVWLKSYGYDVAINIMQISDCNLIQVKDLTSMVSDYPLDVLYFADSMGSMSPDAIARLVCLLREGWQGELGIHTHDNMGMALANTLRAQAEGVSWLDATVTGMGRGPGNARTEELSIEAMLIRNRPANLIPIMKLIREIFLPMKDRFRWGTNPYYYLAGKFGIHPTYIQQMISDSRFDDEDILAVIDHLSSNGGKHFSVDSLSGARQFYSGELRGSWKPSVMMANRDVLILGTGPGVNDHRAAIEAYVRHTQPIVLALNTQSAIDASLISLRLACHPVRLLADAQVYADLPQPLITPVSMLPIQLKDALSSVKLLDYGLRIENGQFKFYDTYCIAPASLVLAYALAVVTSGKAQSILMAGFDGYPSDDPRHNETASILTAYRQATGNDRLLSVTPTRHDIRSCSIYAYDCFKPSY